jgi:dihydroxyacid dehydratase/phosphogluconate dehydratase
VDLSDDELARRAEAYEPPERPFPGVALSKYAKLVSSAAQGAVTF